jgi:hypothetical protein
MHFRRADANTVLSDADFEVRVEYPRRVEYREGERRLGFTVEMTGSEAPASFILYDEANAHWLPPHAADGIEPSQRREILIRVTAALAFLGDTPEWSSNSIDENAKWRHIYKEALALVAGSLSATP